MSEWKSDLALGQLAQELGEQMVTMYRSCGIDIPDVYLDPQGPPSPHIDRTVVGMFIIDAGDFMSLDPQRLIDEYRRMQQVADAISPEGSGVHAPLALAHSKLAGWHGEAADAFAEQLTDIEDFMAQQQEALAYAMQAMGTAFGLAVQFRQSYYDLASNLIEVCRAVIAKRPPPETVTSTMLALGRKMVQLGTGALGAKDAKELLKFGIEKFKDAFDGLTEKAPIDSGDAAKVLGSYLTTRDRLRGSFEDGLHQLAAWLDGQRGAYFSVQVPILDPMPACTDVHSPDFSYRHFFNDHHDPDSYSPRVEREQRRLVHANSPDGPIHRRLKGEE